MHTYVCAVGTRRHPGTRFTITMTVELAPPQLPQTPVTVPVIALIVAATAMATGAWFGYLAWSRDSFADGATAVLLLFTAPALAVAAILSRNIPDTANENTSALELIERMRRLDVSL